MPPAGTPLIDAVILATLCEWAAMLVPGLCLMLSVRSALLGMPWYWMALLLSAAGLAHLADLRRRWTRGPGDNTGG